MNGIKSAVSLYVLAIVSVDVGRNPVQKSGITKVVVGAGVAVIDQSHASGSVKVELALVDLLALLILAIGLMLELPAAAEFTGGKLEPDTDIDADADDIDVENVEPVLMAPPDGEEGGVVIFR